MTFLKMVHAWCIHRDKLTVQSVSYSSSRILSTLGMFTYSVLGWDGRIGLKVAPCGKQIYSASCDLL
jgi:hypothetical protein